MGGHSNGFQWRQRLSLVATIHRVFDARRKLKYCAYYLDMHGVEDNPALAGVPMDCYEGCAWDPETRGCVFQSSDSPGTYRHGGGCRQPATAAAGLGASEYLPRCHAPEADCASDLLVSPDRDGVPSTVEAIRYVACAGRVPRVPSSPGN